MNCTTCRHSAIQDAGYSIHTLEGQVFFCIEQLNPNMERISWESYEDHSGEPYNFAESCSEYREGKPSEYSFDEDVPAPHNVKAREYDDYW